MIQDIAPHRMDNQFRAGIGPEKNSPILIFTGQKMENIMVRLTQGRISFPVAAEMPDGLDYTFLFTVDDQPLFMVTEEDPQAAAFPGDLVAIDSRKLRPDYYLGDENRHLIFEAYTAGQLARWYHDNRYCGTCAHKTVPSKTERALCCPHCGRTIYPRILPAVIIGVTDGDRILMTKYAGRSEEVGLKVKNIRYYKSQPWGIVDDLLAGFYCDVDGSTEIKLDRNELKEAVWVERKDVEGQPHDLSLTNEMMVVFREGREPLGYRYAVRD